MKVAITTLMLCCLIASEVKAQNSTPGMPQIKYRGNYAQLLVDGKPLLMTAGGLGNSSASGIAYMEPIWPKLQKMHLNTLIAPPFTGS